jgi:hypothetical protein
MGHFAKVVNGTVVQVIVAEQDFFDTFIDNSPGQWIKTSYNTSGNVHYGPDGNPDGGVALRGNFAGVGHTYDHENDVFIEPKPFPSWTLSTATWLWEAPVPLPQDGKKYCWNESTLNWDEKPEYGVA